MNNLYLDFDGVINTFSARPPHRNTGWTGEWREKRIDGERVFWSVELVDRLMTLSTQPDVQVVFASDWRSKGLEYLEPVFGAGKDRWDVLDASDDRLRDSHPWWKMEEIENHRLRTSPSQSIWVDDNIGRARGIDVWRKQQGVGFMTLVTDQHHGITRKDMTMIENVLLPD